MELLSSLYKLQRRGALCDVSLLSIEGCSVPVHTVILAAASSTICGRIVNRGGFQSITTNLPESTLQGIVRYIYTGLGAEDSEIQYAIQNLGIDVVTSVSLASTAVQTDNVAGFQEALDLVMSASQATTATQTDLILGDEPETKLHSEQEAMYYTEESAVDNHNGVRIKSEAEGNEEDEDYDTEGYADLGTEDNEAGANQNNQGLNMLSEAVLQEHAQEVLGVSDGAAGQMGTGDEATDEQQQPIQEFRRVCDFCNQVFEDINDWKQHRREHAEEILTCNICGKVMRAAFRFRQHMKSHAPDKPPRKPKKKKVPTATLR